jgi:hypothetical protein
MLLSTSFDNIDTNILDANIDLAFHKIRRNLVNAIDPLCILGSQSGCRGHRIASMSGNHFLICFQTPGRRNISGDSIVNSWNSLRSTGAVRPGYH